MAVSIRLDTPGGSNFENYAVRNVSQLSVGQSALPDAGNAFQVTGNVKVIGNIDANDVGTTLLEAIQDRVAAMFADSASIDATYDDVAGTISLAVIAEAVQDIVAGFLTQGTNVTLVYDDVANTLTVNARNMTGATALAAGTSGAVPAPAAGDQDKALHGDGTFRAVSTTDAKVDVYDEGTLVGNAALDFTGAGVTVGALVAGRIPVDIPGGGGGGGGATTFVGAKAYLSADQSIAHATTTSVLFNLEAYDSDGFHDNATNQSRFTVPTGKAGKYEITAQGYWASNGTGYRIIYIRKNGTAVGFVADPVSGTNTIHAQQASVTLDLIAGDYIEFSVEQTSGAALPLKGGNESNSWLAINYVGASSPLQVFTGARAYATANQSIANATWTSVALPSESYDSNSYHDNATNNSRFTVPANRAGKYEISARVRFAANTTGGRWLRLWKNGTTELGVARVPAGAGSLYLETADKWDLAAGDYIEAQVYQDSGAALDLEAFNANSIAMSVLYLGGADTITPTAVAADASKTTTQGIPSASWTTITLNENFDTDGIHDVSTGRFTVPAGKGGKWLFSFSGGVDSNTTGIRAVRGLLNGTAEVGKVEWGPSGATGDRHCVTRVLNLAPGDYLQMQIYQNSGATLNTTGSEFGSFAYLGA